MVRLQPPPRRRAALASVVAVLVASGGGLGADRAGALPAGAMASSARTGASAAEAGFAPARTGAAHECRRTESSVRVYFSKRRYPRIIDHFRDAVRDGHPRVLHIARDQADENRDEALDHWEDTQGDRYPEAEREGKDRDRVAKRSEAGSIRYAWHRSLAAR